MRGSFGRDSCERGVAGLTRRVVHLWYADETISMAYCMPFAIDISRRCEAFSMTEVSVSSRYLEPTESILRNVASTLELYNAIPHLLSHFIVNALVQS